MKKGKNDCSLQDLMENPDSWAAPDVPYLPVFEGKDKIIQYIALLLKWNKALNLSGIHSSLPLLRELIQDSFFLSVFLDGLCHHNYTPVIWDLGAGAGLPGVPLRIFWSKGKYTWIESSQKRSVFLQNVQARLKLPSFNGYNGRVEDFFKTQTETRADFIISRAFRPWHEVTDLCAPVLAANGLVIIMANNAPPYLPSGWRLKALRKYHSGRQVPRFLWALSRNS